MGYDPRAVKVSKSIKRAAATILDKNLRRGFIKSYARAEAANARQRSRGSRKGSGE